MASNTDEDALDTAELAPEKKSPSDSRSQNRLRQREKSQFNVLAAELDEIKEEEKAEAKKDTGRKPGKPPLRLLRPSVVLSSKGFWHRLAKPLPRKDDPYFDYHEAHKEVVDIDSGVKRVEIPTLKECQRYLKNEEAEEYGNRSRKVRHRLYNTYLDTVAALFVYLINTIGVETLLVVANAAGATAFYIEKAAQFAVKLDFAFLALSVIFPLTFLIQSTFSRRDMALARLADFKGSILSSALFTLTSDWSTPNGEPTGGRLTLPDHFNAHVLKDFRDMVLCAYEYLSMPNVSHARNVIFWEKQNATKRVHALQNDLFKRFNDIMFDLSMHTEVMRKYGFPSGEASRLHQYHQYIQQRFEHLRNIKYYRTPQAARSFGRAYILILPWISGPYFAWVFESTNKAFTYILACFTFLILLGLLNAQQGLEDPFVSDSRSLIPGIDNIKLDLEMAIVLQSLEQYYAKAELQRLWEECGEKDEFIHRLSATSNLAIRIEDADMKE